MGLIKKYQADSKMNYSFDNNNNKQQNLVKKQYDKNAAGVDSNTSMYGANMYADENFKQKELDFSPIKDNQAQQAQNTAMQSKIGMSAVDMVSGLAAGSNNSTVSKVGGGIGKSMPYIQAAEGLSQSVQSGIKKDEYGQAKTNAGTAFSRLIQGSHNNFSEGLANKNYGQAFGSVLGIGKTADVLTSLVGKDKETKGFFGFTNKATGRTKQNESVDKEKARIKLETDTENVKIAKEKDIYLKKARDQQSSANLYNGNNSKIYKKGGKLIPRFRRGGELDLEKENVILDGPSHDDHNKTGVKGDKGLPVVNKGTKVAEIESLELILNKNSSVKIEKLAKEYKKTGDAKILNKIGEVMKKEINDNTYDYSKEIL